MTLFFLFWGLKFALALTLRRPLLMLTLSLWVFPPPCISCPPLKGGASGQAACSLAAALVLFFFSPVHPSAVAETSSSLCE